MSGVVQLKFTVSRIDSIIANEKVFGLVFYDFVLAKKSEDIITDRILVSDETIIVQARPKLE
jgi:hypothetical protein